MRILDRYILRSVVAVCLMCILTFLFLYVIIDVFAHLDEILKQKVALKLVAAYYLSSLPIIFVQIIPIACLLGTLYAFGRLNRNNEIIAMRASGMSVTRIAQSVVVFGLLVSTATFIVQDRLVPRSLLVTHKIKAYMERGTKAEQEKENEEATNLSVYGLKNRLYFVNRLSLATNTMEGISILEHDARQNIRKKIIASRGTYNNGVWTFYQCVTYEFDEKGQIQNEPRYLEEEIMSIPETPQDFLSQRQSPDFMSTEQLAYYIRKLSGSGATSVIRNLRIDLYQRYASPLTSVIIIIIGIPFSLLMRKRATGLSSLGIAMMVGFLYYVVNAVSIALGKAGVLPPLAAVLFSHAAALASSAFLIARLP